VSRKGASGNRVPFELEQITKELLVVATLNERRTASELDDIQTRAAATCLHSIYNGIEKILFELLPAEDAGAIGTAWHSEILQAAVDKDIITAKLANELRDFMGFRHFFRHNYGFMLDSDLLKPLLDKVARTVDRLRAEIAPRMDGV
jgi:hypothetical protein